MEHIENRHARKGLIDGTCVIVDVREPGEYRDQHITGAINIPSTKYDKKFFEPFKSITIGLICQTGNRSSRILEKLKQVGYTSVKLLSSQMEDLDNISQSDGWSIDRQFRMTLGILLALFLILTYFGYSYGRIIPVILCVGLIFTSIIDRCYMRMAIAQLPWNKNKRTT